MNKKLESRRATSNNQNQSSSIQHAYNSQPQGQPQNAQVQAENNRSHAKSGSPAQSLSNIQKISARLRARNPVIMSMTTSPQMLLPLSQRSLSPSSYQQLATTQQQDQRQGMPHPSQVGPNQQIQNMKNGQQKMMSGQTPNSREFTHQRKIMHKSLNSSGMHPNSKQHQTIDNSMGMMDQRTQHPGKSADPNNRTQHVSLNMSAHMISSRQNQNDHNTINVGISSDRGPLGHNSGEGSTAINLKQKISGHRKRNAREKSYDLYNQKLQLPPMMKPGYESNSGPHSTTHGHGNVSSRGNGKAQDRTYSLPSAGHGQVHQSMPMSPNMAMNQIASPKSMNHPLPQRQSINDALKSQVQSPQGQNSQANRFSYNNVSRGNGQNQSIQKKPQQSSQGVQGVVNLNSMKGFFSARGQGMRSVEKNTPNTDIQKPSNNMHSNRSSGNQMAQNSQISNGMFSPRRQIINGAPSQQAQFVGVRQPSSTKTKSNSQQAHSLTVNSGGQNNRDQPTSATVNEDARHRQSLTLSPRGMPPTSSSPPPIPQPQAEPRLERHDTASTEKSKSTAATDSNMKPSGDENDPARTGSQLSSNQSQDQNIQFVEVQTLLFGENPPVLNPKTLLLKNHEPTKASQKKCGMIKSYAANTNQGIIREYNEDRVSIILNILKPKSKAHLNIEWPQICFFGVFDGHGGAACADYLRDNLHNFVVQNENFPQFPKEAIIAGFKECERSFLNLVEVAQARAQHSMPGQQVGPERSGSCATVVMIVDDMAYVINVGDSRCIMSMDAGSQIAVLSRDHKPDDDLERQRIQAAGGKIYRTQTFAKAATSPDEKDLYVQGPLRVFPGRLSVSRTFGDIEAKRPKYGGNPNVIVCEPEIKSFKLKPNFDFFLIGCDGIFERMDNKQTIEAVWNRIEEQTTSKTYDNLSPQTNNLRVNRKHPNGSRNQQFHYDEHIAAAEGVEIGLREAAASRSLDNITILILGLKNLKTTIKKLNQGQPLQQVRHQNQIDQRHIKNTYEQDFEYLEVNEQDLNIFSDNDVNSANDSQEADNTANPEGEKTKKSTKVVASPTSSTSKSPPSRQQNQSSNLGTAPRKA